MDVLTKVKGMITKTVTILRNHKGTSLEPKRPLNQRRIDESSRPTSPKQERQPVRRRHHRVPQKPLPPLPKRRPPARKLPSLPSLPNQTDPEQASQVIQPTFHRIKHRHTLSVPVAIVECLDSNSCTRKITGDKKELQRMYKVGLPWQLANNIECVLY